MYSNNTTKKGEEIELYKNKVLIFHWNEVSIYFKGDNIKMYIINPREND